MFYFGDVHEFVEQTDDLLTLRLNLLYFLLGIFLTDVIIIVAESGHAVVDDHLRRSHLVRDIIEESGLQPVGLQTMARSLPQVFATFLQRRG